MSIFRSEEMGFYHLALPRESSRDILNELGELSAIQFVEHKLNDHGVVKPFSKEMKRCEEALLNLSFIEKEMKRINKPIHKCFDADEFFRRQRAKSEVDRMSHDLFFEKMENFIESRKNFILDQMKNFENLLLRKVGLIENIAMLFFVSQHIQDSRVFK